MFSFLSQLILSQIPLSKFFMSASKLIELPLMSGSPFREPLLLAPPTLLLGDLTLPLGMSESSQSATSKSCSIPRWWWFAATAGKPFDDDDPGLEGVVVVVVDDMSCSKFGRSSSSERSKGSDS